MLPEHPFASFNKVQVELSNPFMLAVYIIAMVAVCWHFAYGVWLFAAKWGITPGDTARRRFGWVCLAGGIILCAGGLASIYAFVGPMYPNTPADIKPPAVSQLYQSAPGARGPSHLGTREGNSAFPILLNGADHA
jgi:succinate dehydrogenase / fumarate reductase cytochrome b subunit